MKLKVTSHSHDGQPIFSKQISPTEWVRIDLDREKVEMAMEAIGAMGTWNTIDGGTGFWGRAYQRLGVLITEMDQATREYSLKKAS